MPVYGIGQGSQNSPAYWIFTISTLLDCHQRTGYGATYVAADGSHSITLHLVGFVDDTNNNVNDLDNLHATAKDLIRRMQHDAQLWSELLWASGGKLQLEKYSYYLIEWTFSVSGAPVLLKGSHGPPLLLTDPSTGES